MIAWLLVVLVGLSLAVEPLGERVVAAGTMPTDGIADTVGEGVAWVPPFLNGQASAQDHGHFPGAHYVVLALPTEVAFPSPPKKSFECELVLLPDAQEAEPLLGPPKPDIPFAT